MLVVCSLRVSPWISVTEVSGQASNTSVHGSGCILASCGPELMLLWCSRFKLGRYMHVMSIYRLVVARDSHMPKCVC